MYRLAPFRKKDPMREPSLEKCEGLGVKTYKALYVANDKLVIYLPVQYPRIKTVKLKLSYKPRKPEKINSRQVQVCPRRRA